MPEVVNPQDTIHVFVSYAREDSVWLDLKYKFHLIPYLIESLRRQNVAFWFDTDLKGGDEYKRQIESEIDKAHIALLIVSQSFLNSEFIETFEMPRITGRAQKGEMLVIPVLVEPCAWIEDPFLADRQMVPSARPLIEFIESPAQWARVRFQILEDLKTQVKRMRETIAHQRQVEAENETIAEQRAEQQSLEEQRKSEQKRYEEEARIAEHHKQELAAEAVRRKAAAAKAQEEAARAASTEAEALAAKRKQEAEARQREQAKAKARQEREEQRKREEAARAAPALADTLIAKQSQVQEEADESSLDASPIRGSGSQFARLFGPLLLPTGIEKIHWVLLISGPTVLLIWILVLVFKH